MTDGQRAHQRLQELLRDSTRTHRRPETPQERREREMSMLDQITRSRNGRKNALKYARANARLRRPK